MLRQLIIRGALAAIPFLLWFLWAAWARRTGRPMGSTPWPWLVTAGAALLGLSLMASVVFHSDNRGERYVPGEARPDGRVTEGHFEKK
ncbi:MAG TPA: hypothetical protein VJU34_05395 [Phenylobacterium sp.]|nr:hypothetical protein [Phenylobacterium sp.]